MKKSSLKRYLFLLFKVSSILFFPNICKGYSEVKLFSIWWLCLIFLVLAFKQGGWRTFFYFLSWNVHGRSEETYWEKSIPHANLSWHQLIFSRAYGLSCCQNTDAIFLKYSRMHQLKRFFFFATNGNKINFSLFSSWQVNVTMPGRTTSAKRIASAFPQHSLEKCRGIKRMWMTFVNSISRNCMLIWGQNLACIYFQCVVISRT